MAYRRKKNGLQDIELFGILGAIGVAAYLIYQAVPKVGAGISAAASATGTAAANVLMPTGQLNATYGNYEIPGTGQSVSDLVAAGWSTDEINQLLAQANQTYGTPVMSAPVIQVQDAPPIVVQTPAGWAASL
jgi:hypothetical protein